MIEKGEAVIAGISVKNDPMKKQIIGVQLQESHYFDYLKLKELLDLFGEFYHRKIDGLKLLREVQLEDKKKLIPRQLSGGSKTAAFHRLGFGKRSESAFFGRADHGPGSAGAAQSLGIGPPNQSQRQDCGADDALYGRGSSLM